MALLWTEPSDVIDRWLNGEIPATDAQIETFLGDAEDTILREYPDIPDRLAATPATITLVRIKKVAARMVIRYLRNPEGLRTFVETTGPFTENATVAVGRPGEIYLTDEDRADLATPEAHSGRAFQVDMTPQNYVGASTDWTTWNIA